MYRLDQDLATRFALLTLAHLGREYPYHFSHVTTGDRDLAPPRSFHPIFHGSYDWHSCVHGWWQILCLARQFPDMEPTKTIRARADEMFLVEKVRGELAYFERPSAKGFERPYGWAWLLALHLEASAHDAPWADALEPLARELAKRFGEYLSKLTYPVRSGAHTNSAFAVFHFRRWADRFEPALGELSGEWVRDRFARDLNGAALEPSGEDFLSPSLTEAVAMSQALSQEAFRGWFTAFFPALATGEPTSLLTPVYVSDRSDGKIGHLDGLNLSRAWGWRVIGRALGPDDPHFEVTEKTALRHLEAGLPHVAGNYLSEHWLATFALLALIA